MKFNIRSCAIISLVIIAGIAMGLFFGYRYFSRRADIRPLLSPGAEAELVLPPGFSYNLFASGLDEPRFIAFDPDGLLHVAERGQERVIALPDADQDGQADEILTVAQGLPGVHSLAFNQGSWFVGLPSGIMKLADSNGDRVAESVDEIVGNIPSGGQHRTRTVAFLPDGRMVLSVGSSCNVCLEEDSRRAAVLIYDGASGSGERIYATGLRNAVGLAVHPETGDLWATNNARDLMGDDIPADTLHIIRDGADYGWPACHAGETVDPEFGTSDSCEHVEQPVARFVAHSAPLGLAFYNADRFPEEFQGDLFVAFHGSWNRSQPTGYKVVRVPISDGQVSGAVSDFAVGWLDPETNESSGRPVGLAVGPDGALYVSDDKGGFIYRIYYSGAGS